MAKQKVGTPKRQMLTKKAVKERGWTDTLIHRFMPSPDATKQNCKYRSGPRIKLFDVQRVEAIEQKPEFQELFAKAQRRKAGAQKVADTLREQTLANAENVRISIRCLSEEKVLERACAHYNQRARERELEYGDYDYRPATPDSDTAFLHRITVNFIRHCLTNYEAHLDDDFGRVGKHEASLHFKRRVLTRIAETYPWLAKECERQIDGAEYLHWMMTAQ